MLRPLHIATHKDILWLDVSVDDALGVEIDQCYAQLPHGDGCISLTEVLAVQNAVKQVAALHEERQMVGQCNSVLLSLLLHCPFAL